MRQEYSSYTTENHETWKLLFERQAENLQNRACTEFLLAMNEIDGEMHSECIPDFRALDTRLWSATGWTIEVVPGLIPVKEFFELLSRRRFCSSTWIRRRDQMDYLEEPDMFHDTFGHIPLLMNPVYADFMQKFGEIGTKFADNPEAERQLERLYWHTIEFGLILEMGEPRIYGAGIASSFGETNHIFDDGILIQKFDVAKVMAQEFRSDMMQTEYFAIDSFEELFASLEQAIEILDREKHSA